MKLFYSLLFIHLVFFLTGQFTLVEDLNVGSDDTESYSDFTFTLNQEYSIAVNESMTLIKLSTPETNWELYKITANGIELVSDIAPGDADSDIDFMTLYNDKVYFIANDGTGHSIWESDGTTEGTKMAFGLGTGSSIEVNGFIVGRDNKLYFEFKGSIFSYDGVDLFEYAHDEKISIVEEGNENSRNWCQFQDGIAIMDYSSFSIDLLSVDGNGVKEIASYEDDPFAEPHAMAEFENGVIFSFVEDGNDSDGMYSVNATTGEISKLGDVPAYRVSPINGNSCLAKWESEYLLFNGDNPFGTKIHDSDLQLTQGEDWPTASVEGNIFYLSSKGFFLDDTYSYYNSETGESKEIYTAEREAFRSKQIGSFALFGGNKLGSSSDYAIYSVNLYDGTMEELVYIEDPESFNVYIEPISIVDGELYFFAELDNSVGQEIYKATVELNTSVKDVAANDLLSLEKVNESEYLITYPSPEAISISIYDVTGRLIDSKSLNTNTAFSLPNNGMYLINVKGEMGYNTFKAFSN